MDYKLHIDVDRPYELQDCRLVRSIIIPKYITIIGAGAFQYNRDIKEIIIPSKVTKIGECALCSCKNLTNVIIQSNNIKIMDAAFEDCKKLYSISIKGVTEIGDEIFFGCDNLTIIDSNLSQKQIKMAFGDEEQYNNYCQRNRDYKLNMLENEL